MDFLILFLIALISGSIDSFDEKFVEPSIAEQKIFKNLLEEFQKLDIDKKDVSGILKTFEKPSIITFPCDTQDKNDLVVNVVETRLAGFDTSDQHEGGVIVGGTYSWQCKITTSSQGIITMDCDNTLKINPDVVMPIETKDERSQEIDNLVILYHELLHGQLMLDAISSSPEWRNDVCNKTPDSKIDYSYSDKQHVIINPLQENFADQLVQKIGGIFFHEEIIPNETDNGVFTKTIANRLDYPQLVNSGIKITYRGINTDTLSVSLPKQTIIISGNLKDKTQSGIIWLYAFPENKSQNTSQEIPKWVKNNSAWWSDGSISDSDFLQGIEFLVQNNILVLENVKSHSQSIEKIPNWVRNNAKWWSTGLITDEDFVLGIKYLIEAGIIDLQ